MQEFIITIKNFDGYIVVKAKTKEEARKELKRLFKKCMIRDYDNNVIGINLKIKIDKKIVETKQADKKIVEKTTEKK